jgi:cell division septal protein FtsQ
MSRRDYEEGYEDARRESASPDPEPRSRGDASFTAAVAIKYLAIVIVVLIIAWLVLQVLGVFGASV